MPASHWEASIWGRKAPASTRYWADPEVGSEGTVVCTLMHKPKVDRARLKALLLAGRCFFAAVPVCTFLSTQGGDEQADYWSLLTFTWHADTPAFERWVEEFAAADVFAHAMGNRNFFPAHLPSTIPKLGNVLKCLPGRPSTDYVPAPRSLLQHEQLVCERALHTLPRWAASACSWYSVVLQQYSKRCADFTKNGIYGLRMLGHFMVSAGRLGPPSGYKGLDVLLSSPRLNFQADNIGCVCYDMQMSKQMFVCDFFTKWFPWKHLAESECLMTIALDAECSQWEA